jgi:hypothetical protein
LAASALALHAVPSAAQVSPALDRFSISIGAFYAEPKINAGIGNRWGYLDSGDIKADRKSLPRVNAEVLIGHNHGLSFEAYRYSQGYGDALTTAYTAGPLGISGTAGVKLDFDLDVARLGYRYWFGSGSTVVGVGAGIGYARVSLDTLAYASAGASLGSYGFTGYNGLYQRHDSDDVVAPMLEVGVRHAFTPDLRVFFDGSGIHKGGGGIHGSIYQASLGVEWFPVRNVGVSLAYAVTDVDLKRDESGLQRLRLKFQGPVAAIKARF